ncbi:protein JINGUBANG [Cornus florida]|uniref:protein JINGUBANG n=1 Tax=Cornus florida TaxID=4283 RepID=UPI00289A07EC|nr:protein JINGUBANG [Cornus florida]
MMLNHQACCSSYDSQPHSGHLQPKSTSLHSQSSLSSIPSLTSQHKYPPTSHQYQCIATLRNHNSYISSLALAGKFICTGSSDKEIRLWERNALSSEPNQENQTDKMVLAGKGAVKSLVVLADKIFSAHQDQKIRVWKIDDHKYFMRLATLPTLSDRAHKLLIPNNYVQVRRHKKCTWVHHVDAVSALALSKDESLLYSVSWDRTLKIWRTTDFKCLESIRNAHDDAINAVALSSDGDVYTGSADKKIKAWRKSLGEKKHFLVATLEEHKSGVNALALSADDSVLYSGACDRSIVVWEKDDSGNMVVMGALRGHTKAILCLAVVSNLVCSGSADKTVRIWAGVEKCYSCLAVLEGHKGPVKCLTAASDRSNPSDTSSSYLIYSSSLDCDLKVWQILVPLL